jgi:hypothetical protein
LESAKNIELDEVVVQDVTDYALELAAGGAQRGYFKLYQLMSGTHCGACS